MVGLWEKSPVSAEAMGAPGVCRVRHWRSVGWGEQVDTDSPGRGHGGDGYGVME